MSDEFEETTDTVEPQLNPKSAPEDREITGPLDESEANAARPYLDLGSIKVLPREGLNIRLEIEENTQRVVAAGLDYRDSTLQVQPFAAPRNEGLWTEIREQIVAQIQAQGGQVIDRDGAFGPEVLAQIPVAGGAEGEVRLARFIGVDGPRWFLRGVISGAGATDPEVAAEIDDLFRGIVVVRGNTPMPPRDLIPLKMPVT